MDLFDRIYKLHQIFKSSHYPVSRRTLEKELRRSRATVKRCIENLRDYLFAPIEYDRHAGGYFYSPDSGHPYELPGLWFNASELQALLTVRHYLTEIQPGLLESHLEPLRQRLEHILSLKKLGCREIGKRIRILGMAMRPADPEIFTLAATAVLQHKRLQITYHSRSRNTSTQRSLSPQRLAHYRDNWYLDAWDHGKRAFRSFALERIKKIQLLKLPAKKILESKLNAYFESAYGIFAGRPKHTAVLRFTPERSRWVAEEKWHPQQKGKFENGCYILEVPYSDHRELIMDILKHGPHIEVLAPQALRQEVIKQLDLAIKRQKNPLFRPTSALRKK